MVRRILYRPSLPLHLCLRLNLVDQVQNLILAESHEVILLIFSAFLQRPKANISDFLLDSEFSQKTKELFNPYWAYISLEAIICKFLTITTNSKWLDELFLFRNTLEC